MVRYTNTWTSFCSTPWYTIVSSHVLYRHIAISEYPSHVISHRSAFHIQLILTLQLEYTTKQFGKTLIAYQNGYPFHWHLILKLSLVSGTCKLQEITQVENASISQWSINPESCDFNCPCIHYFFYLTTIHTYKLGLEWFSSTKVTMPSNLWRKETVQLYPLSEACLHYQTS